MGIIVDWMPEDMGDSAIFSFNATGRLWYHSVQCEKQKVSQVCQADEGSLSDIKVWDVTGASRWDVQVVR